jgi:DNA-binding CsgD family transcriptional regulator
MELGTMREAEGTAAGSVTPLIERDAELESLAEALSRAEAGEGAVVAIEGAPGLGKSWLIRAACDLALEQGMEVATAACRAGEEDLTFGTALQLLEARLAAADAEERARLLGGPARPAAALLSGERPGGSLSAGRALSIIHGLSWICRNIADQSPLLIAVDDAERSDAMSLHFLLYLIQRLRGLPIAVVLSAGPIRSELAREALAEVSASPETTTLPLRPLTAEGMARQLRDSVFPDGEEGFYARCFELTAGNPGLARDIAACMAFRDSPAREGELERLEPDILESVAASVRTQLRGIDPAALELATAVAILGEDGGLEAAAALTGLARSDAVPVADALRLTGTFRPDEELAFAQPIVQPALYAAMLPAERAEAHVSAAHILRDAGSPPERVAAHLLRAHRSGNEWAVESLLAAGREAVARGAPAEAVRYLRRALAEPASHEERPTVVLELGRAEALAGEPGAADRLRGAVDLIDDPPRLASAALGTARTMFVQSRFEEAARTLLRAMDELDGADERLLLKLRIMYAAVARLGHQGDRIDPSKFPPGQTAGEDDPQELQAYVAFEKALAAESRDDVVALARRSLRRDVRPEMDGFGRIGDRLATFALMVAEDLAGAEQALDATLQDARARGSVLATATAEYQLAEVLFRRGRLDEAAGGARSALSAQPHGWLLGVPGARAILADRFIERGDREAAERWVAGGVPGDRFSVATHMASAAHLSLLRGEAQSALDAYTECGRHLEATGVANPAVLPWRLGAAVAASHLGDLAEARALVNDDLRRSRRFGAPAAVGRALGTLGAIEGARGGLEALEAAVDSLRDSPAELDKARALLEFGSAARRAGRRKAARAPLLEALDCADRCGATVLVQRARDELGAAGARPRRTAMSGKEALSPRERQVADLAAEGRSNREIAETLFVTVKTVEWHLRHAYEKLGVSSRSGLASALRRR